MVVSFDTSAELVADLIDDTEKLETAIRGLRPGGGTALLRRHLFRLPRQALEGPAPPQIPPRHRHRQRRRR